MFFKDKTMKNNLFQGKIQNISAIYSILTNLHANLSENLPQNFEKKGI